MVLTLRRLASTRAWKPIFVIAVAIVCLESRLAWGSIELSLPDNATSVECSLENRYGYEDYLSANRPWSASVQKNKSNARFGPNYIRVELRKGDCGSGDCQRTPKYERTEFAQLEPNQSKPGHEIWWGWSLYVPPGYKDGGKDLRSAYGTSFAQFQQCCRYEPAFMFIKHVDGPFKVSSFRTVPTAPHQGFELISDKNFRGRWHDFIVHARWSLKKDGFLKVWVNGKLKADYHGPTMTKGNKTIYHKFGLYRSAHSANPSRQWAYFDEIRRGKNRACVDIRRLTTK